MQPLPHATCVDTKIPARTWTVTIKWPQGDVVSHYDPSTPAGPPIRLPDGFPLIDPKDRLVFPTPPTCENATAKPVITRPPLTRSKEKR